MLSPYRVLDLTDEGALICGQILADLGADVILVEPPCGVKARSIGPFAGDEHDRNKSLNFWALNRNKRGIRLRLGDYRRQFLNYGSRCQRPVQVRIHCISKTHQKCCVSGVGCGRARRPSDISAPSCSLRHRL